MFMMLTFAWNTLIFVIGIKASLLVSAYSEYEEYQGQNVVDINNMPEQIYNITIAISIIFLIFSGIGFILFIKNILNILSQENLWYFIYALDIYAVIWYFTIYLVWKYKSLSSQDKDIWNKVDIDFIYLLYITTILFYIVLIPGIITTMIMLKHTFSVIIYIFCETDDYDELDNESIEN